MREKFDHERDMYLKRIKELEGTLAAGASQKDSILPTVQTETGKSGASAISGGELLGGLMGKEEESRDSASTAVHLSSGGSEVFVGNLVCFFNSLN